MSNEQFNTQDSSNSSPEFSQPDFSSQQNYQQENYSSNYSTATSYVPQNSYVQNSGYNGNAVDQYNQYNNAYGYGNAVENNRGGVLPENPKSSVIMILGILGIVSGLIFSILGWVLGRNALNEPSAAMYNNETIKTWTKVSKIFTIIWAVLTVLLILFYILLFAFVGTVGYNS